MGDIATINTMFHIGPEVLFWMATACYAIAFFLSFRELARKMGRLCGMSIWLILGFSAQSGGMVMQGILCGGCPIGGVFEIILFLEWSLMALYLLLGRVYRSIIAGALVSLLSVIVLTSALVFLGKSGAGDLKGGGSILLSFHAALGIFSYGVLGMLFLSNVMYLWQVRSLHRRSFPSSMAGYLPSVKVLDITALRLLFSGVMLLGTSIAAGAAEWCFGGQIDARKALVGIFIFLIYSLLLFLRLKERLLAARFAWGSIILFALAVGGLYFIYKGITLNMTGGGLG